MKKQIINYTWDKTAKTITFTDINPIRLDAVLMIVNATRGVVLYVFGETSLIATVATNVLTLNSSLDTSAMDNADKLLIYYDDSTNNIDATIKELIDQDLHALVVTLATALVNLSDSITVYQGIDAVMAYNSTNENYDALVVKTAIANVAAGQTDQSLVAAVTGKKIRVIQMFAQAGAIATDITFNSKGAGAGTPISPTFQNGINGGEVLLESKGWFETNTSEALTVTTGEGSTTGVLIKYVEF